MVCVFIMNRMNSQSSGFAQRRRMALGIVMLLLVDVIWVASSELTSVCNSCPGMMSSEVILLFLCSISSYSLSCLCEAVFQIALNYLFSLMLN